MHLRNAKTRRMVVGKIAGAAAAAALCAAAAVLIAVPAAAPGDAAAADRNPAAVLSAAGSSAGEIAAMLADGPGFDPGKVLVGLPAGMDPAAALAALSAEPCAAGPAALVGEMGSGWAELPLAEGVSVADAMAALSGAAEVASVQPDYNYTLAGGGGTDLVAGASDVLGTQAVGVNDPQAGAQWYLASIRAYEAWDGAKGGDGDPRVTVAVMDSGCAVGHPDLAANIAGYYDASSNGTGIGDIANHGTAVCGIISGVTGNGIGVAGASYNARVFPIQVFSKSGGTVGATSASLIRAYNYIIAHGDEYNIRVANLSLGTEQDTLVSYDRACVSKIEEAYDAGILTVTAAGNVTASTSKAPYTMFPCDYMEHGMGVIALSRDLSRSSASNCNREGQKTKDISAPGTTMMTISTASDDSYAYQSGTSMAAPCVSAAAALLFTADPGLTPAEAISILHESAKDLGAAGFDADTGYGEVDLAAAVGAALAEEPAPDPDPDPDPVPAPQPDPQPQPDPDPQPVQDRVMLYRLFNPATGEHLYTLDSYEYYYLGAHGGWNREGVNCALPEKSDKPVYRLFSYVTGDHHYTSDAYERSVLLRSGDWRDEDIGWYSASSDGAPVYRLYNPRAVIGAHHYTADSYERRVLIARDGWKDEQIGWYGIG